MDDDEAALIWESRNGGTGTPTVISDANVLNFTVSAGNRSYERDQMQAGTLDMPIDDTNRTFDPTNTSSSEFRTCFRCDV